MQNTFSVATNKEALCRLVEVTRLIRSDEGKANDRKTVTYLLVTLLFL